MKNKRIFIPILGVLVLALSSVVFAQSKGEQEVRQTLDAIADALVKNDVAALSNIYADSYTITNPQGETMNKTQRLDLIKNTKRESFSYGDVNIRVFGNTAIVIASPTFTNVGANGERTNFKDRATLTMMKNGGRWQVVAVQSSNNLLSQTGGDEQGLRQTIDELSAALGKNDVAALDRIYADDYTFVGDNGMMMTKAERIGAFKSGDLKYESVSFDTTKIQMFGDTAIALIRITSKFAPNSKFKSGKFFTTGTFAKIKGRWQLIAAHNTRLDEQ